MDFAPNVTERLARARADLRMGVPVMVVAKDGSAALIFAIESLSPARLEAIHAQTQAYIAITQRRAATLKVQVYDTDLARLPLPANMSLDGLQALADPSLDLRHPLKGPFHPLRGGDTQQARAALALAKSAHLLPAVVILPAPDGVHDLTQLDLSDMPLSHLPHLHLHTVASARVPLAVSTAGRCHVFRPENGGEEHYAIEIGRPSRDAPVLARLHSACFTGDVMGSLKCDCGPQLHAALAQMGEAKAGILLYLNQEGRGIGLANKMRAYALQDQGFDTVEANHRLGFEDDERDFRIGAEILRELGFDQVRLMTNNPAKIAMMEHCGLTVTERVPLKVGQTDANRGYLATKAAKSGHLL